jgi:hypothetical protein
MSPVITAEDVARNYRRTVDHIYVIARRRQWRRIRWQGRVHYYLDDVDRTLGRG